MDDRYTKEFEDSVDPKTKQNFAHHNKAVDRLVETYQQSYKARYGTSMLLDNGGRTILSILLKNCNEDGRGEKFATELIETFLTCNDEWFLKTSHSLMSFKNNLNVVVAAYGAKHRGKESMKGVQSRNPVDVMLYYLWESQMYQKARKLIRTGDTLTTETGHKLTRDGLREYFKLYWLPYGTEELSELSEVLDRYLKELRTTPTPETA